MHFINSYMDKTDFTDANFEFLPYSECFKFKYRKIPTKMGSNPDIDNLWRIKVYPSSPP